MEPQTASIIQEFRERLNDVNRRIEAAARVAGRAPEDVSLIAVSKTHPPHVLQHAIDAGVQILGENRVQEAEAKIKVIERGRVGWHLIGHLQANKARRAVELFDVVHSLDSRALALRLDRMCHEQGRDRLPVLIQVDLSGEKTKSGVSEDELQEVVATVTACERLTLLGLMTLPPFFEDPEAVRPFFRRLRALRDELHSTGTFNGRRGDLSMGMSNDYEIAIQEGATMVRVGTAIFGERR